MDPLIPIIAALTLGACGPTGDATHAVRPAPDAGAGSAQAAGAGAAERTDVATRDITITTDRGQLTARLADNGAARKFAAMLPLTIRMRDHLRQEKTGVLTSALPDISRQTHFSTGTLGLWGERDFVIYYKDGRVPAPGIVVLGSVGGDLSILDNADGIAITVRPSD